MKKHPVKLIKVRSADRQGCIHDIVKRVVGQYRERWHQPNSSHPPRAIKSYGLSSKLKLEWHF